MRKFREILAAVAICGCLATTAMAETVTFTNVPLVKAAGNTYSTSLIGKTSTSKTDAVFSLTKLNNMDPGKNPITIRVRNSKLNTVSAAHGVKTTGTFYVPYTSEGTKGQKYMGRLATNSASTSGANVSGTFTP